MDVKTILGAFHLMDGSSFITYGQVFNTRTVAKSVIASGSLVFEAELS